LLCVLLIGAAWAGPLRVKDRLDYEHRKSAALQPMAEPFQRFLDAHKTDPAPQEYLEHLERLDEVACLLIEKLSAAEFAAAQDLLQGVLDVDASNKPAVSSEALTASACEILERYQVHFAKGVPTPVAEPDELGLLRRYYKAAAQAAADHIAARCERLWGSGGARRGNGLELSVVLPFLDVPDEEWSAENVARLAPWQREHTSLCILEEFALSVGRPLTAYEFAAQRARRSEGQDCAEKGKYLRQTAEKLVAEQDYQSALRCLECAKSVTSPEQDPWAAAETCLKTAKVYGLAGHYQRAADECKAAMDLWPGPAGEMGLDLARMKYLYELRQYDVILQEHDDCVWEGKDAPFNGEKLYIFWVACQRKHLNDRAEEIKQMFLENYGDHALAADMHFATAMSALAHGKYDEAVRALTVVESRFPDSKLMPTVRSMKRRLTRAADKEQAEQEDREQEE